MLTRASARQWLILIALGITLIVNFLSEAIPLNGQTSAEIANRLPIFFVPANYVFGIWSLIYTLLIAYAVYQALPSQKAKPRLRKIGSLFIVTCAANGAWLVLFHYNQFALSMAAMIVLLVALIMIYNRLDIPEDEISRRDKWLIHIPFSVYLGWITVATVANAAYVLYDLGWDGWGLAGETWAAIMLVAATAITLGIILRRADAAYVAVIVWAFIGIVIKQSDAPLVAATAGIMSAVVVLALVARKLYLHRPGPGHDMPHQHLRSHT